MKKISFLNQFEKNINQIKSGVQILNQGKIINLGDGIATIGGLLDVTYNELVQFAKDIKGLAFNLEEEETGIIILGDFKKLKNGDPVERTGQVLSIPVGEELLGRVINPLGEPLDGKKTPKSVKLMPLEKLAPSVITRQSVNTPLQTGIKAIDSMLAIGRGQRELIIGDRGTGKTTIAVDTILNQKDQNVICIYVAIGQKQVRVARIAEILSKNKAFPYSIIVAANASDNASLQYIAPYAGCAIAEYFMEKGKDVLIIYDDLSKHAWAYRQISLLLKRPSGREAYPGDIFYLHSRLLERSAKLASKYGGGSITALPIIETQAGDVSAYIPTNVISITDGQIYLESDLFFAGVRPAINIGLSVSRVGGAAQLKAMKKVAGQLRIELAQYRDLAAFTQFTTDLDPETKKKIDRGSRISELFKQQQHDLYPVTHQISSIWAATNGYLDQIPVSLVKKFEKDFLDYLTEKKEKTLQKIIKFKEIVPEIEKELKSAAEKVLTVFKKNNQLENEENKE